MEWALILAVGLAVAFALTNGFHDAANAIAALVATRGATPGQAVAMAAVATMAGALLLGTDLAEASEPAGWPAVGESAHDADHRGVHQPPARR